MKTFDIQQALRRQGFDPGPVDGAMGPLTRAAIARFEKDHGLSADGAPDDAFLKALLGETQATAWLPWYAEAERRKGLHEIRDKVELAAFLRSDGATLGDPTKLPWCGDFVETCVAVGLPEEPLPENPYLARNWLKFGVVCAPTEGAVLVFWRGAKSGTSGHVGFYAGEDGSESGGAFHVLGGNQSNAVTIARIAKSRLLGARWPRTAAPPKGGRTERGAAGALSTNEA
jgi:uncharacterized protein (TIGR02594 family)